MPDRFVALLLRLYPEEFRARFGPQIEADLYHPGTNRSAALFDIFRSALYHRVTSPGPYIGLAAMALGWKTPLTGEVDDAFMQSGTLHVFAISGLHIALVAGLLVKLFQLFRLSREQAGLGAIPCVWLYVAATGWQPSAIRSAIMASVILVGSALHRPSDLLNSLSAAAALILLMEPDQLFQSGFQLSFGAVAGLVVITPACGFVNATGSIIIGILAGIIPFIAVLKLKGWLGYDDALDVVGVHGMGGLLGAILTGVFASKAINPDAVGPVLAAGRMVLIEKQLIGVAAVAAFALAGSLVLTKIISATVGLRATEYEEWHGLDRAFHGEVGYGLTGEVSEHSAEALVESAYADPVPALAAEPA